MDHVPREVEILMTNTAAAMEFLDYAPQARTRAYNYDHYLDRLGFGTGEDAHYMRTMFKENLRNYVRSFGFEHIPKKGNEQAYEMMIKRFFSEHGNTYWGSSKRVHLVEQDPSKGFLYPRDTERQNSNLIKVFGYMFDYRSRHAYNLNKDKGNYHKDTNFAAMRETVTDMSPMQKSKKRQTFCSNLGDLGDEDHERSGLSQKDIRKPDRPMAKALCNQTHDVHDSSLSPQFSDYQKLNHKESHMSNPGEPSSDVVSPLSLRSSINSSIDHASPKQPSPASLLPGRCSSMDCGNPAKISEKHPRFFENRTHLLMETEPNDPLPIAKSHGDHPNETLKAPSNDQGDEDCMIVEDKNLDIAAVIKKEHDGACAKTGQLSSEPVARTTLIVTASNQPTIAPVFVPLTSCNTFPQLFKILISECDIRPDAAKKVSKISARYTWDGKQIRIRKERPEDWSLFYRGLRKAWDKGSEGFEDGWEVEMMVHVDD